MAAIPSLRVSALRYREQYPNLIGAWGFDEGSGSTTADSSAHGLTLTLDAGVTWATGHSGGTALENAGSGAAGGAHVARNITDSTMTIMGWARPLDLTAGSTRPLFGFWDVANTSGSTWVAIWAQRGNFSTPNVLQGNVRAGGNLNAVNSSSALTVNVWTHLALSYDGTTMRLYQDGTQVASTSQPGAAFTGSAFINILPDPANAQVDDVRFFGTALTQAEIQAFMQQPVAVP